MSCFVQRIGQTKLTVKVCVCVYSFKTSKPFLKTPTLSCSFTFYPFFSDWVYPHFTKLRQTQKLFEMLVAPRTLYGQKEKNIHLCTKTLQYNG